MKRTKLFVVVMLVVLAAGTLAAQPAAANRVVVYTPAAEELVNILIPMFEEQTGIEVELITAGTGELVKRVEVEQHNPYADVFWGSNPPAVMQPISHLFEEYVSSNDEFMLEQYRNLDGIYTQIAVDLHVILLNRDLMDKLGITVNGYADLLQPELKGKIAHGDATASSSAFLTIVNMLYSMGDRHDLMNPEAWDYIDKFLDNLDGKISSSSGVVHRSVAEGEYPVGLTWEIAALTWVVDGGAPVDVIYMEEGNMSAASVAAKIENSPPNPENAEKFIDFLTSEDAQKAMAQVLNRPLRAGVELPDFMKPLDEMDSFLWDVQDVEVKSPLFRRNISSFSSANSSSCRKITKINL